MGKIIMTRDEFVNECYKSGGDKMNEGLLDFFKTVFRQEWKNIKSKDATIKSSLEKIDQGLSGFSLMKLKNAGKCNDVRQAICDFANDLLIFKLDELENGDKLKDILMGIKGKGEITSEDKDAVKNAGEVSNYMKQFGIKDKTLAEKLKTHEQKIHELCNGDPNLVKWSNLLKSDIRNVVNDIIIQKSDADDKDKYDKIIDDQKKEEQKKIEAAQKEAEKQQEDALKKIEDERRDALSNVGVTLLKPESGNKAVGELQTSFDNISKIISNESEPKKSLDEVRTELGKDTRLGFKQISEWVGDEKDDTKLKQISSILDSTFKEVEKNQNKLKDVMSDAVQALYVGLTYVVGFSVVNGSGNSVNANDKINELLARCSIDSDKTIGYGFPLMDEKKPKVGNIFVSIMSQLMNIDSNFSDVIDSKDFDEGNFKRNIGSIFEKIKTKADELKKKQKADDEAAAKKAEQEADNENK